jgi:hypothetical protein
MYSTDLQLNQDLKRFIPDGARRAYLMLLRPLKISNGKTGIQPAKAFGDALVCL